MLQNDWDSTVNRALILVAKAAKQGNPARLERAMRVARGMLGRRPKKGYTNGTRARKVKGRQNGQKRVRTRSQSI